MLPLTALPLAALPLISTFEVPPAIAAGLASGSLIRNGGVIQNASGQVVMWLKEIAMSSGGSGGLTGINSATGVFNLAMEGVNSGISIRGFAGATKQLNHLQGTMAIATGASVLSLGISAMGFAMLAKRVQEVEQRLEDMQQGLEAINHKLDLSFYVNFRAALDLATNAFTMSQGENRRSSALNAINRFLEAEHVYADLADQEIASQTAAAGEYLTTLAMSYVAEARCYLELGEFETATRRLEEGQAILKQKFERYVNLLLTPYPAMYLDPSLKGKVDLARLTRIYQWKDANHTESSVFEKLRRDLTTHNQKVDLRDWVKGLPPAVVQVHSGKKGIFGGKQTKNPNQLIQELPITMERMESMVETCQRFAAYASEIQLIKQLGISFSDWLNLAPEASAEPRSNVMFILPEKSAELAFS